MDVLLNILKGIGAACLGLVISAVILVLGTILFDKLRQF